MQFQRIRDRLLLATACIGLVTTLAFMVSVSLVLRQQYLDRAQAVLGKATELISDELTQRRAVQRNAAAQLATLRNLGSTIWYLGQYTQSNLDRETLLTTFLQLTREARKVRLSSAATTVTLFDAAGRPLVFAHRHGPTEQAGFLDTTSRSQYLVATVAGDDIREADLQSIHTVTGLAPTWPLPLPREITDRYAVQNGQVVIEAIAPVVNEVFDPASAHTVSRQVGLVVISQTLDAEFVQRMARLTNTEVNVFTPQTLAVGTLPAFSLPPAAGAATTPADINQPGSAPREISVEANRYYQGQLALVTDGHTLGNVAILYSQADVNQAIRRMNQTLLLMALLCFACIVPLAWYFATSLARPLSALTRVFHAQAGDLVASAAPADWTSIHQHAKQPGETGDLARGFLAMRDAVILKMEQVNELNASLEHQVAERTQALELKERASRSLLENSPDSIIRYDQDGTRVYANPAFLRTLRRSATELLGQRPADLAGHAPQADNDSTYQERLQSVLQQGREAQFEFRWDDETGVARCFHVRMIAEFDADRRVCGALSIWRDISDRLAYESIIWKQANYDALTQLPNRRLFSDRLEQEAKLARRTGNAMVLMLLDLDHFKEVNDSLGHDHGDMLLEQTAQRIAACVRASDTVARLGGDEFAALLSEVDGIESAQRVAQSIVEALATPFTLGTHSASVSVSIGLTVFPTDTDNLGELLKNADLAMYAAKSAGRNTYQYYTPALRPNRADNPPPA